VITSGDGNFVFYAGSKYLAANLASNLGGFGNVIHASNHDGSVVFGETNVYDGNEFSVIRPLPLETSTMALSADETTLYLYDEGSSRIYLYDVSDL
jgi:hypothetical protein